MPCRLCLVRIIESCINQKRYNFNQQFRLSASQLCQTDNCEKSETDVVTGHGMYILREKKIYHKTKII